ncbi:MAG: bifunctional adenosylcobinamide kinase/adenosylcobinamide-phosphate guanylyltransferase [Deltaproteobacteria bacterium]|nr:bifunctional adenosylcobinamide kinase/adenosylcobinamide-phosphate guanylyltransferase [Deltaproteobacteria bacterium]
MSRLTLITGGTRSGKSSLALDLALEGYSKRVFIATAVALDPEMRERISRHQKERGHRFQTVEEPLELHRALVDLPRDTEVAVVDCLTVWLGNLYHHADGAGSNVMAILEDFLDGLDRVPCDLILVTNEVGCGIVPDNALARSFRDTAGYLNRKLAEKAARAYFVCMGIPLTLKGTPSE